MKLYVWHDVLCDYTCGVMFALANSVEEARELIRKYDSGAAEHCNVVWDWGAKPPSIKSKTVELDEEPTVYDIPVGFAVWGGS